MSRRIGALVAPRGLFRHDSSMKNTLFISFCLCSTLCTPATAADTKLPSDLARAVAAYDAAQTNGDGAELRRLLADDYTLVNSSGEIESKAQLIADYMAPGYKLNP